MVMTFVHTPWSHYNTITEPHAQFLLSLMEDLSIDFPSHGGDDDDDASSSETDDEMTASQ